MSEGFTYLRAGDAPILIIVDHASNHVPADIDLGIKPELLNEHMALDIGAAEVAALVVEQLQCSAILGGVSRLVVDLNREEHAPHLIPAITDGHVVPGNVGVDAEVRLERYYRPYHRELESRIRQSAVEFILSLHSFTPQLFSDPATQRPWEIGVLYNQDDRGARIAIPLLEQAGLIVGDQEPYSGVLLNSTMNRHAEGNGIPYLGVEMRQDMVDTPQGQMRYASILGPIARRCHESLQGARQKD